MENKIEQQKYVALLRGINVGGRHKVPMAELRKAFEDMRFSGLKTLLNTGNVIFEGIRMDDEILEKKIADQLEQSFGFPIPVLVRKPDSIQTIISSSPFKEVQVNKDTRLYITFLMEHPKNIPSLPCVSPDGSFEIISIKDKAVVSALDLSKCKTVDAMNVLEKLFGKNITTRNWNTVLKIGALLFST